jgi:hypothetical protein
MADLAKLDIAGLEAELHRLQAERTAIGDRQDEVRAVLDAKLTTESADRIVAGLSGAQRDAVVKAVEARAAAGAETVG